MAVSWSEWTDAQGTRADPSLITEISTGSFADLWPRVVPVLRARLRRRGVPASCLDDVLQETALAAWRGGVAFHDEAHLLAWATTVSRRLAIGDYRRRRRLESGEPLETIVDDLEAQALARLDLGRVLTAIGDLSPQERIDLVATAPTQVDRKEAVRVNVRRHRARQKLLLLVGGLGSALGLVVRRLRLVAPAPVAVLSAVVAVLGFVAGGITPGGGHEPLRPEVEVHLTTPVAPPAAVNEPVAPAAAAGPTAAVDGPPRRAPAPAIGPSGGAGVIVDPPGGLVEEGRLVARPRAEDEPTLCAQVLGEPVGCATVPFPTTPLDDVTVPGL